jgi:hypothetical protein
MSDKMPRKGHLKYISKCNMIYKVYNLVFTAAEWSKTRNIFARRNIGIVGSNPTRGMDVCVYYVFVLSCAGSGLATGLSPVQEVLPTVYIRLINSEVILNRNRPEGLIRQGRRRRRRRRRRRLGLSVQS